MAGAQKGGRRGEHNGRRTISEKLAADNHWRIELRVIFDRAWAFFLRAREGGRAGSTAGVRSSQGRQRGPGAREMTLKTANPESVAWEPCQMSWRGADSDKRVERHLVKRCQH